MFAEVADPKYSPRPSSVTNSHSFFLVPFFPLIQMFTKYQVLDRGQGLEKQCDRGPAP